MAINDDFYLEIQNEVTETLRELGTSYRVRSAGVYDPGTMTTGAGTNRTVEGLVADAQTTTQFGASVPSFDGEAIDWQSSRNLLMTAEANPLPKEEVEVNGVWYALTKVAVIKPADIVIMYVLALIK